MLRIIDLYVNSGKMAGYHLCRHSVSETLTPEFSWSVASDTDNDVQTAFELTVKDGENELFNTGWIESREQKYVCEKPITESQFVTVSVKVKNTAGEIAESDDYCFICSTGDNWKGEWITHPNAQHERPVEFSKSFTAAGRIEKAVMYVCGVGYHYVKINGDELDNSVCLDPATSNYEKSCYYTVLDVTSLLYKRTNEISITVADGWRYNDTNMFRIVFANRPVEFFGDVALTAYIDVTYTDGTKEIIATDGSWKCRFDKITNVSIFKGETYNANVNEKFINAVCCKKAPAGKLRPMTVEPIKTHYYYSPESVFETEKGTYILDFGQNMAGIPRVIIPFGIKVGEKITLRFGEMLDFDGNLFNEPLRDAPQIDTYISNGRDGGNVWSPKFTYHGFRYCELKGYKDYTGANEISVESVYTDIDKDSYFKCGSALATKIHENCVMTERSNIHSILTDCPQRDERMGWMNDATVRFQETPYNFDIGHIFAKVAQDIKDEQRPDGAFTCCAPFIYGGYPADPVCSSYLMLGVSSLMHNGNLKMVGDFFDGFAAWENSLLSRSDDYIVNYSYYGDWAGPYYACGNGNVDDANSSVTPGIFMSTGYSYFNCKTLAELATVIGRTDDAKKYADLAEKVKSAMLEKWFDAETGKMATGSEGCQAFALWLGIIPEDKRAAAAKLLRDDLVERNYMFTTGNLCTRYMFDMLTEYGYIDEAWTLITNETYPSYGYMIQNEATTVWERFELKRTPGMNSHNHPMYAAVDYWFYAYICGVKPTRPGYEEFTVKPYYPEKLISAECTVDTVKGKIFVRWIKKFGKRCLYVNVPFGTSAKIYTNKDEFVTVGSGSHTFIKDI